MKQLVKRYKFEIFPSPTQKRGLGRIFGSVRFVYNEFLKINQVLWDEGKIHRLTRSEMQEHLVMWREGLDWLSQTPSQSLQVASHDLDVSYQNFFAGRGERPRFKKKDSRQSFQLPQPKIRKVSNQTCVFVPNMKTWIPIRMHREFPVGSKLGAATITKTPSGRHYISVVVKYESAKVLESKNAKIVGVDLNIKGIVLSNGVAIKTPQILATLEARKRRLQKSLQRKRDKQKERGSDKRSNNYEKNRIQLAKLYEKIAFAKEDFLRKTALQIFRENQAVAMETLNVKGMVKNRCLARAIIFQSWGRLAEIMKLYAVEYDKQLHFVSTWFPSSKLCHACGLVNQGLTLADRKWTCECGHVHDRDINAAINIAREGWSCPAYKPAERKGSVRRPSGQRTTMASVKQESSRFEAAS